MLPAALIVFEDTTVSSIDTGNGNGNGLLVEAMDVDPSDRIPRAERPPATSVSNAMDCISDTTQVE